MAWMDEDWDYRMPLAGHNTGISAPDAHVVLSAAHKHFWDNVLSTSYDIRITSGTGHITTQYERTSWDYANRAATLELFDGETLFASPGTEGIEIIWLYYGNAAASDTALAITSIIDFDFLAYPLDPRTDPSRIVVWTPQTRGQTEPPITITKGESEQILIWFDVSAMLHTAENDFEGSIVLEHIKHFWYDVLDGGVSQSAMFDFSKAQVYQTEHGKGGLGRMFLGCFVKAGTAGDEVTVRILAYTSVTSAGTRRVLEGRCILKIQEPAD